MHYYLNEDKTTRPCTVDEWAEQLTKMNIDDTKHIGLEDINGLVVSTVWMGLDHRHFESYLGSPLIFETMVFPDAHNLSEIYCERYSTWQEAVEGHQRAIKWALNERKQQ